MKFLVLFVFVYACLQVSARPDYKKHDPIKICLSDLNLDGNTMSKVSGDLNAPEENVDYGNFFDCVWRKKGVTKEDGTINVEGFASYVKGDLFGGPESETGKKALEEIIEKCSCVQGETRGVIAIRLNKCVWRIIAKYYNER